MWITRRTPYVAQAERMAALTTNYDVWLILSTTGPDRLVVAIGPKTLVCQHGELTEFDAPCDIPSGVLTHVQEDVVEHHDALARQWYAADTMPYALAVLSAPHWGAHARMVAEGHVAAVQAALDPEGWYGLLETPDSPAQS
jgi:hypothetical protein